MPVNTIARPAWSAAATTSASFTDPPGWMIARTSARAASSTPSANGKNASEANTAPVGSCPCWRALCTARNAASTRDVCPAPMPIAASSRASRIAFDLTAPTAAQANRRSRHAASLGGRRVTTNDAASSADCSGRERALVRLGGGAAQGAAARGGVLDDRARRAVRPAPRCDGEPGGVHVEQVIERQLLAVQLLQVADPRLVGGVQRRGLVRILAIAQLLAALERQRDPLGPAGGISCQIAVDRGVVSGAVGKDLGGQLPAQPRACARGQ